MKFITFNTKYITVHANVARIIDLYHKNYTAENGKVIDNYGIELVSSGNPDSGNEYALSEDEYDRLCDVLGVQR